MKVPSSVLWQLTKKSNSYIVKFNGQQFSHDPLNLTGFHNATDSGVSNDRSIGLVGRKIKSKKGTRSVFTLLQKHKDHNKITKRKKNSTSGSGYARTDLRKGIKRIAKVVKGLPLTSERVRKATLRRLQRLHVAYRTHVKGVVAKKEEKK
jgi:hypothetical protein